MRLLRPGARGDGKHPTVKIQGKDAKVKDEKHGFTFKKELSSPFLPGLIPCQKSGGKLTVKEHKPNAKLELPFPLRRQRCFYCQPKTLTDRQQQFAGTSYSKLLLEVVSGRRKLVKKPQGLDSKLRPIGAKWRKVSGRINPERKAAGYTKANQVQEIIPQIPAADHPKAAHNLALCRDWRFDESFVGAQSGFSFCEPLRNEAAIQ